MDFYEWLIVKGHIDHGDYVDNCFTEEQIEVLREVFN